MIDIALATAKHLPDLAPDDQLLLQALEAQGMKVAPLVWDDPKADWASANLCIIRSTWDYAEKRDAYVQWAKQVSQVSQLWNPASLIAWNTDKTYLQALENQGFPIVPTVWLEAGSSVESLSSLLSKWRHIVIKPAVSASGHNTIRVDQASFPQQEAMIEELLASRAMMVQPFLENIEQEGEISLIYIQGNFTHAVQKVPAQGEFRIQEHYGGQTKRYSPSDDLIALGREVMSSLPTPTLYGRVDLVQDKDGMPQIMEVEVTEPSLYLAHAPESVTHLTKVLAKLLNERSSTYA